MKQGQKVQGKQGRKSLKGTRGNTVGAPPKSFRMPNGKFSIAGLVSLNVGSCELTCRKKLKALTINLAKGKGNPDGTVYQLQSRKQAGGGPGAPEDIFVTKENYDKTKMVLFQDTPSEPAKTPKVKKTKTDPAAPLVDVTPAPVETVPVSVPVAEVAPIAEATPVAAAVETASTVAA